MTRCPRATEPCLDQLAERTAGSDHDHVHVRLMPQRGRLVAASGRSYAERVTGEELLRAVTRPARGRRARRLVYADYLQHHDDPQGELIALQCRLASLPADDALRGELAERAKVLIDLHGGTWASRLGDGVTARPVQLGLAYVAQVIVTPNALDVLDRAPIHDLGFAPIAMRAAVDDDRDVADATEVAKHLAAIRALRGSRCSRPAWPGEPTR